MATLRTIYKLEKFYDEALKTTCYKTDKIVRMSELKVGDIICMNDSPGIFCVEADPIQDDKGNWGCNGVLVAEKEWYPNEHWT